MRTLDELPTLGSDEFDRLSEAQKLEWVEELLKVMGDAGAILAVPSPELLAQWEGLAGQS